MARKDYSANALIPHGHHQNWILIEKTIREVERITDQWPNAETEIKVEGSRNLHGQYSSLLNAKIDLGDDIRDVTTVDITRLEEDDDSPNPYLAITLAKSPRTTSWVYASGPIKRTCEELVHHLQAFILQQINYPTTANGGHGEAAAIEARLQHLHPVIKTAAIARLRGGHGDEAVEEACKTVGARLRKLSGIDDDGASLVAEVLGKKRIVALNKGATRSDISEQDGYMHLGMALYRAARNPRAHRPSDPNFSVDEIIEWLSVASALHRALDRATPPT
ncbi:TIGR02391 family protein [Planotetraspora sp. A-T 1434]|uniref:TIGR02391 family protein n=1 Tax=Planotetraspora sp. A-T 1434 TaxID=2979219 RepID=UPI0021BDF99B|nr:TIGR02391 family protein [Planotetraspora sp. A-T 1434]MCT9931579.1 TIGR02391 family protein [Planotetraspora sp. A-T 1434]